MLKICDVAKIMCKTEELYYKYKSSYYYLKNDFLVKVKSVKYSEGGLIYPLGKFFQGQSKIHRKEARQSPGHFCKDREKANFIYGFSEDNQLITIYRIEKNVLSVSTHLAFVIYDDNCIYIIKYDECYDYPSISEIGISVSIDNREYLIYTDTLMETKKNYLSFFFDIIVKDNDNKYEYSYYSSKELFSELYDLSSNEELSGCHMLHFE